MGSGCATSGAATAVGETAYRKVDVRVLSATHRDLRKMVNQGAFREDLFFRLAVLPLHVPPLRERLAERPLLLEGFLGAKAHEIPNEVLGTLMKLPWTGNVRELRNFAERVLAVGAERALAMATSADGPVEADAVSAGTAAAPESVPAPVVQADVTSAADSSLTVRGPEGWLDGAFKEFRDRWADIGEREYLRRLMLRTNQSSSQASRAAQVDRTYLYRLLKRHNM